MNTAARPVISLNRSNAAEIADEPMVMIDRFEALLPARLFQITYKAAEKGGVSMTGEFVLRLLHAVERMKDSAIAAFFGFDRRELSFVMAEMMAHDYVTHVDGYVCLTPVGRRLFSEDSDTPQIIAVEKHTDQFGFDLVSLCPQEKQHLPRYAWGFPRLTVTNAERAANATKQIPQVFRHHFMEFAPPRRQRAKQQYLYSVDHVYAEDKFMVSVPVRVMSKGGKSTEVHADLSEWRNSHELDDRADVVAAVSVLLEQFRQRQQDSDGMAYAQLIRLAPDFLSSFTRQDGLAVERYHKTAVSRVGDLRADRPTIPLVGSMLTPGNVEKLFAAIRHSLKRLDDLDPEEVAQNWPREMYWLAPAAHSGKNGTWGKTRALGSTLDGIRKMLQCVGASPDESLVKMVAVTAHRDRATRDDVLSMFNERQFINEQLVPGRNFELMCIPGIAAAALVHAPIKSPIGFPVPLGFLSFDPEVVTRAEAYFANVTAY